MFKFTPVPVTDHDSILGQGFNTKFASEMAAYYAPFLAKKREIQVAKETWEYAVADSLDNATWMGAGKNVIDVKGMIADFDVKGLSCGYIGHNQTTEASFLQNNKKENDNFTKLFESQDFNALKEMFVDPLKDKIKNTNNLHMFCIIRDKEHKTVYYTLLKVEPSTLTDSEFVNSMKLDAGRSVSVPMIDNIYGKTYIYIPKRRLEIRLNPAGMSTFLVLSHSY
jgi:hypothetical protein